MRKVWAETILPLCEERRNKSRADIIQLAQSPPEWNIAMDQFLKLVNFVQSINFHHFHIPWKHMRSIFYYRVFFASKYFDF